MTLNITTIWWGTGTFNVLTGLKRNKDYNISAIVSVADNGGTTGAIRDQFGILPPWDIRRAIVALAKNTDMVRQLFEYQFNESWVIWGNKIGNILLTALVDITGDFERAINTLADMFDVKWRIIPVTLDDVHLGVRFEDGTEVIGEKNIDISDKNPGERSHNPDQNITDAFLIWGKWILNSHAREAIMNSDYIIISPGDLYTSIVPNLLSPGMREALENTTAKIIYVCNIMTKRWETTNMEVIDFINVIERYSWEDSLDYVIVNNGTIDDDIVDRYKREENKKPLKIKDCSLFHGKSYKLIERDLVSNTDYARHDPNKLNRVLDDIITGWIK